MLNRSYYSRKDLITPRRKEVSTKILSLGVFIVGVIFLTVGLIMGIQFPDHIDTMVINEHCILNEEHVNYQNWVEGKSRKRLNRIYYFNLDNPHDFLYNNQAPMFTEMGPYIYEETERKLGVTFSGGTVTYGTMRTQLFRSDLTSQECGHSCTELDNLTVINRDITNELERFGSVEMVVLSRLPSMIASIISLHGNTSNTYQSLGNVSVFYKENDSLSNISFGSWIAQNDTTYKAEILSTVPDSLTELEMTSLYSILTNVNELGVTLDKLRGYWGDDICDGVIYLKVCDKTFNGTAIPTDVYGTCSTKILDCGFLCLLKIAYMQDNECLSKYVTTFDASLCPGNIPGCFKLTGKDDALVYSYLDALNRFILVYLFQFVYNKIDLELFNLYVTKTQRELSLGYVVRNPVISGSRLEIDGLLPNDVDENSAKKNPLFTLYTCLEQRDLKNNFLIKEYNGSRYAQQILGTSNKISIQSSTSYIRPSSLHVCTQSRPTDQNPDVFVEALQRPVRFSLSGEAEFRDETVYRVKMNPRTFKKDNIFVYEDGLQRLRGLTEPLEWISNPYFWGYNNDLNLCYNITPLADENRHLSYIDIEPATGLFWVKKFRFQYSIGVREKDVRGHVPSLSTSCKDQPLPVYWVEQAEEIDDTEYDRYQHVVTRLMRTACGGLIGMTVLAIIVMAIGIGITALPRVINKVSPSVDEPTAQNNR